MAYTPSTAINNSRDFRNQYLRKSISVWVQKLKARQQKRQDPAIPITLCVADPDQVANQGATADQIRSEQSVGVANCEYQAVVPRNAA
ncbi:hypothetical protein LCGC14_1033660 [marine sediment metagenome]|uniref:Uncharacterized protein n=2 Tax=root TaxID=1 RepID=A0A831R7N3_9GAMM|nr:hypothetical protein [Marinobacter antarcticus]HEA53739.1 hypothetical protein [Marinobacter antarcticus]